MDGGKWGEKKQKNERETQTGGSVVVRPVRIRLKSPYFNVKLLISSPVRHVHFADQLVQITVNTVLSPPTLAHTPPLVW